MKLSDFPYETTSGFVQYTDMINGLIAQFNKDYPSIGTICPNPTSPEEPTNEDRLAYWDNWNDDICWGRYLQLKKTEKVSINFWTGLSTTCRRAEFIIWFEKLSDEHRKQLEVAFGPKYQYLYNKSSGEVWIKMSDSDFETFCKSKQNKIHSKIIKDFWESVLKILN
jgi:hypothetical protein